MSDSIFLINQAGELTRMGSEGYGAEIDLQLLIEKYPDLIPGALISPSDPRRWIVVGREIGVPNREDSGDWWSVDHLLLDQDGIPTFVEVKRASDTRSRREVVAQMLDYAANATEYWPEGRIRSLYEERCRKDGLEPDGPLRQLTNDEMDVEEYWELVRSNLRSGHLRLLFVIDRLPDELRRIVEFLNEQMERTEVMAVEIPQFVGGGAKSLVPRVYGRVESETKASAAGSRRAQPWDWDSFVKDIIAKDGQESAAIARKILDWALGRGMEISWGRGNSYGSFAPYLRRGETTYRPLIVYSSGSVAIRLAWLKESPPFDAVERRQEFADQLARVDAFSFTESDLIRTEPSFPMVSLAETRDIEALDKAMNWLEMIVSNHWA